MCVIYKYNVKSIINALCKLYVNVLICYVSLINIILSPPPSLSKIKIHTAIIAFNVRWIITRRLHEGKAVIIIQDRNTSAIALHAEVKYTPVV